MTFFKEEKLNVTDIIGINNNIEYNSMKVFRKKKHTGFRGYLIFLNGAT